jgi:hypothetical protein
MEKSFTISKLKESFNAFVIDAEKAASGNKAAGVRARKLSLEISDSLKEFRKESINWSVSPKERFNK